MIWTNSLTEEPDLYIPMVHVNNLSPHKAGGWVMRYFENGCQLTSRIWKWEQMPVRVVNYE